MKKYVAHGMSMLHWMMEYESDVEDPTRATGEGRAPQDKLALWNDAMHKSNELDSKVLEQSNRITAVHDADAMCQFCPPKIDPRKPEPKKVPAPATGELDAEPHP